MKSPLSALLAAISAAIFAIAASAQPAGPGPGRGAGPRQMDCAKAKDKARCEALNKDIEACRDKVGDDWRSCMHQPAQTAKFAAPKARDCSKARNKERCEVHNAALAACNDKVTRAEHRKCMEAQLPAAAPKKN
ncbi:MAG: hypothetical protein WC830_21860 [Burkholderiales bacterium]|jgi:hypothetical protein